MSLFSIVKTVMDSNGWPSPITAVSSSTDQNMRQSMALANKALTSVAFKKDWPQLTREYMFDTVANQSEYPLPSDFHHLIVPSAVNYDQYYQLKGSLTPIQWWRKLARGIPDLGNMGFKVDVFGNRLLLAPVPSSVEKLVLNYITKNIAANSAGDPIERYTQDTDYSLVDEDIVEMALTWRWRQKKGLDFTAEMAEFNGSLKQRFAQYYGLGELPVGGCYDPMWPLTDGYVRDHDFGV